MLHQHVLPGHPQIGSAILHIGRHIRGAHHYQAHILPVGGEDQLAAVFRIFRRLNPCMGQQRQGLLEYAPLGEGDGQTALHRLPVTFRHTPYGCAQLGKFLLDTLIPAVDVIDAIHHRVSVRHQPGQQQAGGSAQIGGHHRRRGK